MNAATIAQIASSLSNIALVLAIGFGYFYTIRVSRDMIHEMYESRLYGGRPQVIIDDVYANLPEVYISLRNVSGGAAKEISFGFSAPVGSSDGTIISELSYFKYGLDYLAPDKEIICYWDHLDNLLPLLRKKGLEKGIMVTTNYRDIAGNEFSTDWNLNPFVYENDRLRQQGGIGDIAIGVRDISEKLEGNSDRSR